MNEVEDLNISNSSLGLISAGALLLCFVGASASEATAGVQTLEPDVGDLGPSAERWSVV